MATAVKVIQVFLVCACLLGATPAVGKRHGRKRRRCLEQSEMSADSLTRAPCHPNPCKEKWIAEFANETSKTIGSCENHWSCCSQDDQCVTSVLNCTLQNTNSTGLDPRCDNHGISVMPNNCDITIDISKFDSSGTTSVSLAIEYKYNCSEQHYCHSTCRGYTRMMSQRRSGSRGTRSNDADGGWSTDYISEDQASRYCSVSDKDTFKQTTTLQILFPKPQLTLSEHSNCVYNDSDDSIMQASKNCNATMTCSLGLDSEEVENTWIYFRFHQKNTGRIITANCEPRKKERNVNYNWEIYRDEKADCKLEIPNVGDDDVGNYECGILEVTQFNSVNSVAKSQARSFVIFDGPNFPVDVSAVGTIVGPAVGTVVGPAVGGGIVLILTVASVMGLIIKRRKKRQEGGLQGGQDREQHGEQGGLQGGQDREQHREQGANVGDQQQLLPGQREQGYGGTGEQRQPLGTADNGGHLHGPPAAQGEIAAQGEVGAQGEDQVGGRGAAQEPLLESGGSGNSGRSNIYYSASSTFVHVVDASAVGEADLVVGDNEQKRMPVHCRIL